MAACGITVGELDILAIGIKAQTQFSTYFVIYRIYCHCLCCLVKGYPVSVLSLFLQRICEALLFFSAHICKADLDCIIRKLDVSFFIVLGFRYLLISIIQAKGKFFVFQGTAFQYLLRFQSNFCINIILFIISKCSCLYICVFSSYNCYFNIIISNQSNILRIFILTNNISTCF